MMKMYKEEGANPFGGCLPMLLQFPIFIALYYVLFEAVELRHAPFFGWIQDLSVADPYFVLPLLMGGSMWLMQKLQPQSPTMDPMQQKIMSYLPIVFTVFMLFFPAGLVLYWLCNNLISVAQQQYVTKKIEKQHAAKSK
ncbi:MAG: membrane protein insertase YidC, partial [Kangiella sp.]|nr:membrane protein insertase YidC [Kangiella sp.]